jgi:hypothetical protein
MMKPVIARTQPAGGGAERGSNGQGALPQVKKPSAAPVGSQGLRPAIISVKTKGSVIGPLDRLSQRLLDWELLNEFNKGTGLKSVDIEYEQPLPDAPPKLPDVYRTYDEYISAWEPMMIKDMQDSIVSKFSSNLESSAAGKLVCTVGGSRGEDIALTTLECTFFIDNANRKR